MARLVADPANIGSGIAEDARIGLQFANELEGVFPIVVGTAIDYAAFAGTAVVSVAAVRAVEPDLEYRPVVGQ